MTAPALIHVTARFFETATWRTRPHGRGCQQPGLILAMCSVAATLRRRHHCLATRTKADMLRAASIILYLLQLAGWPIVAARTTN